MVIYASPRPVDRVKLWKELDELVIESPWCVMGDFNVVLSNDERYPRGRISGYFQDWVSSREMIDWGIRAQNLEPWESSSSTATSKIG